MPRIDQNIFQVDVPQDKVLLWQVFSDGGKLRSHLSLGGGPGFMKHMTMTNRMLGTPGQVQQLGEILTSLYIYACVVIHEHI